MSENTRISKVIGRLLKRYILHCLLSIIFLSGLSTVNATDLSKRLGIGLGYPYLSLKYGFSSRFTGELRGAFDEGIGVYSVRGYYNFLVDERILGFAGADLGYITFDTEELKGTGTLIMPFVGGEYFLTEQLSVGVDIGPAFISLGSMVLGKDFSISGIEWVSNLGINYYFELE